MDVKEFPEPQHKKPKLKKFGSGCNNNNSAINFAVPAIVPIGSMETENESKDPSMYFAVQEHISGSDNEMMDIEIETDTDSNHNEAQEDSGCSFKKGYIEQDIYACRTCYRNTKIKAGICYNCMTSCHYDHETVFIGTETIEKFRCDCGLDTKFPNTICCFDPLKKSQETNCENNYPCEHEFIGVFCKCNSVVHENEVSSEPSFSMITF